MKKLGVAVYLLFFITTAINAQTKPLKKLVGAWEAVTNKNESGGLMVTDSTKMFLVYGDRKLPIISYKADFSQSPFRFDFKVKNGEDTLSLKSLLLFINDDMVQWQIFTGDVDAELNHFVTGKGDIVFLKRNPESEEDTETEAAVVKGE